MKSLKLVAWKPVALACVWILAQAAPAVASETITFDLSAQQLCSQAQTSSVGDLDLTFAAPWCVASTDGGLLDASITFNPALNSQIPQPPEFFGFFRTADADVSFSFPTPPPEGVQIAAATLLQHLLIVWIFEPDGVSIVPIGDPIAFYLPAPPPYLAGAIAGKARYGETVEMSIRMTTESHLLVVRQSNTTLAAVTMKKIFAHPDAMSYAAALQVEGNLDAASLWLFGGGSFRGVKSPAEVIIGSTQAPENAIGRIEVAGSEVRVHAR